MILDRRFTFNHLDGPVAVNRSSRAVVETYTAWVSVFELGARFESNGIVLRRFEVQMRYRADILQLNPAWLEVIDDSGLAYAGEVIRTDDSFRRRFVVVEAVRYST